MNPWNKKNYVIPSEYNERGNPQNQNCLMDSLALLRGNRDDFDTLTLSKSTLCPTSALWASSE